MPQSLQTQREFENFYLRSFPSPQVHYIPCASPTKSSSGFVVSHSTRQVCLSRQSPLLFAASTMTVLAADEDDVPIPLPIPNIGHCVVRLRFDIVVSMSIHVN